MSLTVQHLSSVTLWARGSGLEIVLLVTGTILLTRLATWLGARITHRIDVNAQEKDALVRSEASKHRQALAQVITWTVLAVIYCVAAVAIAERLGVPLTSLVAPAAVAGVAIGFGAQRIVQDILAGFFIVTERQYGFGDLIRLSVTGLSNPATGTVEDVTLRVTTVRTPDGEVVITPNGQINQVTNLSRDWARAIVDVPVPATADVNRVSDLLRRVGEQAYADPVVRPLMLARRKSWAYRASTWTTSRSGWWPTPCPASSSTSAGSCGPGSRPRCGMRGSTCRPPSTRPSRPRPTRSEPTRSELVRPELVRPGAAGTRPARTGLTYAAAGVAAATRAGADLDLDPDRGLPGRPGRLRLVRAGHVHARRQHRPPADGAVLDDAGAGPDHLARDDDAARPEGHADGVAVLVRLAQTERRADGVAVADGGRHSFGGRLAVTLAGAPRFLRPGRGGLGQRGDHVGRAVGDGQDVA